ncbi:hypothetical protein [Pseudomonas sp. Marseille-Q8238]
MIDARELRLIREFIDHLSIDLGGAVVVTEAGSGPFLYSALVAAMAGARKVYAVAPDSYHATHEMLFKEISLRCQEWGLNDGCIEVIDSRDKIPHGIDIFLNLGFVRPLDRDLISRGSECAVVSYMSEAWEYRPGDLDLEFCRTKGIAVAGVNEDFDGFGVFSSCGQLALKLIFEAGLEVAGCRFAVLSNDPFGVVIVKALKANAANVILVKDASCLSEETISSVDALVVATYSAEENVLERSPYTVEEIHSLNSSLKVIQFSGSLDVKEILKAGISIYPVDCLGPYRMAKTLSYLGSRPVIALHSLGLKVGELIYNSRRTGVPVPSLYLNLVQFMA